MSWFVALSAICWLGGAFEYVLAGNWRMAIVSVCYATATFALIGAK